MTDQEEQERYRYLQLKAKMGGQQDQSVDWGNIVGSAVKEATMRPGTMTRNLATDPTTQAQALPALAGMAGGASGIPMGASLGTIGGRQLSNMALRAYGQQDKIPSGTSQVMEAVPALAGDVFGFPQINKMLAGKQIGAAETAAGLNSVAKEAPPSGMRTAVKFINSLKDKQLTVAEAKQMKPAVDTIFQKGWLRGTQYEPEAVLLSRKIQQTLNQIPGRAQASQAMAQAMTVPRMLNKGYQMIPQSVRRGLGYGTGVGLAGGSALELIKRMMGDSK